MTLIRFTVLIYLVISITVIVPVLLAYNANDENTVDIGRNITLVVVIDGSFLSDDYGFIMSTIKDHISKIKKDYLKEGSLKVKYWNWNKEYVIGDISVVLSIGKCSNTWQLFDRLHSNDLLFIAITDVQCPRLPSSEAITLPMVGPGQELPQLLLDLRTSDAISWKSVSLLYDKSLDDDDVKAVVEALNKEVSSAINSQSSLITLHRINDFDNEWKRHSYIENIMKNLSQFENNQNLLVIVEYEMINIILDVAKSMKILQPTVQCLFIIKSVDSSSNFSSLASELDEGENIAFIFNSTRPKSLCYGGLLCHIGEILNNLGLALEKSINDELELSKQVSDEEWDAIKPAKTDRRNTLLNFILSRIRNGGFCDNCTHWKLAAGETWGQDYLITKEQDLLHVGSWNPREGAVLVDELFPHTKHGFRTRSLPIATFHFPPWQILYFNETGHVTEYKGLVFEIVNLLARNLNFTYDILVPTNTTLSGFTNSTKYLGHSLETLEGKQDESALSNVWNKVIDVVKEKKVFLGACAFTVTNSRKNIINFTSPISTEPYVFLLSRPKELSRALLFMSPFTTSTWFCIVAAIALMTPVLYIINRLSPFYEVYASKKNTGFKSPMTCFWYIYGALLQQGGGALPAADSSRLVIGTWWLVVLVVVTTYSGNLVAFLTFPKMDRLITNVDELLAKKDYITWGIPANSTLESLLKSTDDPKLHEIYETAKLHKTLSKDLVSSVRDGLHVYIQRKTSLLFLMKHEFHSTNSCQFSLGNEEFLNEHLAMIIAQDSPYLKIINKEIGWMHRVGLINKWLQEYLPKKDRCSGSGALNEVTNHKVNLDDMQGSFFVLLLGFIASFLLIAIEFLIRMHSKLREKRVIQPFVS